MSRLTCKEEPYDNEEWKDVRIGLADGMEVKAHRAILGEQCKFFAKMLKRDVFKMLQFHLEVYAFAKFIIAAVLAKKSREKIMKILKQAWEEALPLARKFMGKFLKEIARQNKEKEEKLRETKRRICSLEARYKRSFKQQKSRIRSLKAQVLVKETYRCPRCENIIELVMPERHAPVACYRCRVSRVPTSWKRYLQD
ncbi:hypothetical protein B0J12DRAFT_742565 [Macrophomina phaseolina]|uniref:BTB domain-containing protein n=1 Tax=Macrophomina phaseolina TaxID=35725 RepID=A0ABQ8G3Y8_9PEZI|nr:hypothetical protein B0J12DRAFT_742565 [Macrophomina phaseolina]